MKPAASSPSSACAAPLCDTSARSAWKLHLGGGHKAERLQPRDALQHMGRKHGWPKGHHSWAVYY